MKRYLLSGAIVAAAMGSVCISGSVGAADRLAYPEDINGPPLYASPFYEPDQAWTPIIFWRPVGCIPADANLFGINFNAWSCPFLMDGFVIFSGGAPIHEKIHGSGTPIWFVPTADFEESLTFDEFGNPVITVAALESIESALKGTSLLYLETAHFFGGAKVPFAEVQTWGLLDDDGGTFTIHLAEAWLPPDGEHNIFHYEITIN